MPAAVAVCAGNAGGVRFDPVDERDGKKWKASEVEGRWGVVGADVDVAHCMVVSGRMWASTGELGTGSSSVSMPASASSNCA